MGIIGTTKALIHKRRPKGEKRCSIADTEATLIENASILPERDPTIDADAIVKTMYEANCSVPPNYVWDSYPPNQMDKRWDPSQDRPAIEVFKIKDKAKPTIDGNIPFAYHKITIQNPSLIEALVPILGSEDFHLDKNDPVTFEAPFRRLYFCHEEIVDLHKNTTDVLLRRYLELLVQTLDDILGVIRKHSDQLKTSGLVRFDLAWTHFPNDTAVYSNNCGTEAMVKVADASYKRSKSGTTLVLDCKALKFDGKSFAWATTELAINEFCGRKPIQDLEHFPIEFHYAPDDVRRRLLKRGKKVLDLQGVECCTYKGIATADESDAKHNVHGRILIDVAGFNKYQRKLSQREINDPLIDRCLPYINKYDSTHLGKKEKNRNKERMMEQQENLIFMLPMIEGFALRNRLWLYFHVEDVKPVVWNDETYDEVVYPETHKGMMLAYVKNHRTRKTPRLQNAIMAKGQALVVLLSGSTGTGKTLLAEAVAEKAQRPLLYLQAEDLLVLAGQKEPEIRRVFAMAEDWDAIILLDEADMFMGKRDPDDVLSNGLVTTFVRELEYFRGILFLTTSRYETIDTALRSRVTLDLRLNQLNLASREAIWRNFLAMPPTRTQNRCTLSGTQDKAEQDGQTLSNNDIESLARWRLNGRQIKNVFRMVRTWCEDNGQVPNLERFETGVKITTPEATKLEDPLDDDELYDEMLIS